MVANIESYTIGGEDGQAFWFLDTLIFVKATGESTGGALGLIEQVLPAGSETSYHVHHAEDEYWYVLEGEVTFISGERRIKVTAGSFIFMPRDVPHGLRTLTPARLLVFSTPPGFVDFAIEMSDPAEELTLPSVAPVIDEKRRSLAAKYGIEVLGPLPD